jgi:hypothetical protein
MSVDACFAIRPISTKSRIGISWIKQENINSCRCSVFFRKSMHMSRIASINCTRNKKTKLRNNYLVLI